MQTTRSSPHQPGFASSLEPKARSTGYARQISEYRRIVAFRNILIHGYADVDDRVVWGVVETDLPKLRIEIETLIGKIFNHDSSDGKIARRKS